MPFDGFHRVEGADLCDAWERQDRIQRARDDPDAFVEYVMRGEGGQYLRQEAGHREWQAIWSNEEKSVILGPVGTGKALSADTPIAVPGGWTPIGELVVGDLVLGGDGRPTRVTYVSPTWTDHEVYELTFDDGATILCDAEHLWLVTPADAPVRGAPGEPGSPGWYTLPARVIVGAFERGWRIPSVGLTGPARRIEAARVVPSVPVRCIAVEAAHHTYIATRHEIVTHNTSQLRARLIWEIGRDPEDTRIAYISETQNHPKKQLASIKEEILGNPRIWHVFPHLRPGTGTREEWSQTKMLVQRDSSHPDVTMECYGLYGAILGARKNIVVFDDLCSFSNTLTEASREKMDNWLAEVLSRLKGKVKVWAVGHIWHEDDALQMMRKRGWYYARYQATRADSSGRQVPCFPGVLPPHKIADFVDQLGPVYSRMMLYNEMPPASTSRFRDRWFEVALKLGRGMKFADSWSEPVGRIVTGIDLGHKKKAGSDFTAMVTALVFPDGRARILDVRGGGMVDPKTGEKQGRWKSDEIASNIEDLRERFDPQFYSEDNGGQALFNELMLPYLAIPVTGTWTGVDKYDYANGIEALGRELRSGLWILPCDEELVPRSGVAEMIKGAKGYDPNKHPADMLMAWWICRKGIVQGDVLRRRWELEQAGGIADAPIG